LTVLTAPIAFKSFETTMTSGTAQTFDAIKTFYIIFLL